MANPFPSNICFKYDNTYFVHTDNGFVSYAKHTKLKFVDEAVPGSQHHVDALGTEIVKASADMILKDFTKY